MMDYDGAIAMNELPMEYVCCIKRYHCGSLVFCLHLYVEHYLFYIPDCAVHLDIRGTVMVIVLTGIVYS